MDTLTGRQQEVLEFLRGYQESFGFAPTYREVGVGVGLRSMSSVHHQLSALAGKGWIRLTPGLSRAIVVVDQAVTR